MGKKNMNDEERIFDTPQEEILHLRKRIGGYITQLEKQKNNLLFEKTKNISMLEINSDLRKKNEQLDADNAGLAEQVLNMAERIRKFNALPWYKKPFYHI